MAQDPHVYQMLPEQLFEIVVQDVPYRDKIHDQDSYTKYLNLDVKTPLPESITFGGGNQIEQTWSFMQFTGKVSTALSSGGVGGNKGYSERQYWSGIEPIEFTFELNFNAYYSSLIDVVHPIQRLMAMSAARESSLFGKGFSDLIWKADEFWVSPPTVYINAGKFLHLSDMFIKNVQVTYSNKLDSEFLPMAATASVTFIPRNPIGYYGVGGNNGWVRALNELLHESE